jgi:hypothetical protein
VSRHYCPCSKASPPLQSFMAQYRHYIESYVRPVTVCAIFYRPRRNCPLLCLCPVFCAVLCSVLYSVCPLLCPLSALPAFCSVRICPSSPSALCYLLQLSMLWPCSLQQKHKLFAHGSPMTFCSEARSSCMGSP